MILHINTKDKDLVEVSLKKDSEVVKTLEEHNEWGSQVLLPLIEKILKEQNLEYKDLEGVEVETGPGSFTGLRVGAAVANAIGFALSIKINGKEFETDLKYN